MGLLGGDMRIEQGTRQWEQLHESMEQMAKDMWAYLTAIEPAEWDQDRIRECIGAVRADLHRAEGIWPEGKSILSRMLKAFDRHIPVREEEHRLVLMVHSETGYQPLKSNKADNAWSRAMDKVGKELNATGDEMLACADEVKKWTSIDVRAILGWD